jgi:cytochrome c
MKKFLLILVSVIVIAVVGIITYVSTALPNVGEPENITIKVTPEMLERGQYLVETVSGCIDCHSVRDFSKWAGPIKEETRGAGGEVWTEEMGLPGRIISRNITPFALGDWTDGEIFRAITSGVSKDGRALFPLMPYHSYGRADKEDIFAIIAYLRTIESNSSKPEETELNFPMSLIVNLIPQKAEFSKRPTESDKVEYGKYLTTIAACADCHTPMEKGEYIEGMQFAGGMEFPYPNGDINRSANITPDKKTGIGNFTEDQFVSKFKEYADSNYVIRDLDNGEVNTMMPWLVYRNMKEDDLKAIYAYLMTLKPVKNEIKLFEKKKES